MRALYLRILTTVDIKYLLNMAAMHPHHWRASVLLAAEDARAPHPIARALVGKVHPSGLLRLTVPALQDELAGRNKEFPYG